jgi:hypothetical protein
MESTAKTGTSNWVVKVATKASSDSEILALQKASH